MLGPCWSHCNYYHCSLFYHVLLYSIPAACVIQRINYFISFHFINYRSCSEHPNIYVSDHFRIHNIAYIVLNLRHLSRLHSTFLWYCPLIYLSSSKPIPHFAPSPSVHLNLYTFRPLARCFLIYFPFFFCLTPSLPLSPPPTPKKVRLSTYFLVGTYR